MKKHNFDEILAKIDEIEPSGEPHEQDKTKLQGYTVKALVALIEVTEKLFQQNQKLEEVNLDLQKKILWLTVVMGILALFTFLFDILDLSLFV